MINKRNIRLDEISFLEERSKVRTKTVVLVGGCFDLLHEGHLQFLQAAKKHGDFLIVALENDKNIQRLKGQGRPINKEKIRALNLLKTGFVDKIIILSELKTDDDYLQMVKRIKPNIIAVTKDDPQIKNKQKQAKTVGAEVKIVVNKIPGCSTTQMLKR